MSKGKGKDDKVKINMSFEDALKKAAKTKVNPAMLIEDKNREYEITGISGKNIQPISLEVITQDIHHFSLQIIVKKDEEEVERFNFSLSLSPHQKTKYLVDLSKKRPVEVKKGYNAYVIISPLSAFETSQFEKAILVYKLLD